MLIRPIPVASFAEARLNPAPESEMETPGDLRQRKVRQRRPRAAAPKNVPQGFLSNPEEAEGDILRELPGNRVMDKLNCSLC